MSACQKIENDEEKFLSSFDGLKLHYRIVEASAEEKGVLLFVHGVNEHMERYRNAIGFFSKNYKIYLFDFRGHGLSEGYRSYVNVFQDLVTDLKCFVDFVLSQEKNKKIFMIAHSMGGQIALNYLAQNPDANLTGFMTSSPNIKIAFSLSRLEIYLAKKLSKLFPKMPVINQKIKPEDLTRIPESIANYKEDKLINKNLTLRLAAELLINQEALLDLAQKISFPAFMMHSGEDKVCHKQGSIEFFEKLHSKDKKLKVYEGARHELFNDIVKDDVFHDMQQWLEAHL